MEIKYPHIKVKLVGEDGNAFSVLGKVSQALRRGGCPREEIREFTAEATSGDYYHVLSTVTKWVTVV